MMKMDFSTLIGIAIAILLVAISVAQGGDINNYLSLPSFLIVIGCTVAVSCASFSFKEVGVAFKTVGRLVVLIPSSCKEIAVLSIAAAEYTYKHGILSIEKKPILSLQGNKLFNKWLSYVADGHKIPLLESLINQEIYSIQEQQTTVVYLLKKAAEVAPAFGLIGTLVGLIEMLSSINDINAIGVGMSVALLTTFYGAILSYIFLTPLASKLEKNLKEDILNYKIFRETILSIAKKDNPRHLESVLNAILPPGKKIVYYKYDD